MLKGTKRRIAPIVTAVLMLAVGGLGIADGSTHPSGAVKAKGKKKNHVLSADYKTAPVSVIDEPTPTTVEFSDDAKLVGRPFGSRKSGRRPSNASHSEAVTSLTVVNTCEPCTAARSMRCWLSMSKRLASVSALKRARFS